MVWLTGGVLVVFVLFEILHYFERTKLLNRIMAKDYGEFKYFEERHKKDIKAVEKLREVELKEERSSIPADKRAEVYAEGFEDFQPEDMDVDKLAEDLKNEDRM